MAETNFISEIWKHWYGKILISLIVLVLLFILFQAVIFKRPIDFWGLKLNMCNDTIALVKHDTIILLKHDTIFIHTPIRNKESSISEKEKDHQTIIGKNVNTGINTGIVGDPVINVGEPQRKLDEGAKAKLVTLINQVLSNNGSNNYPIQISTTVSDKESQIYANEIAIFLKDKGYSITPGIGLIMLENQIKGVQIQNNKALKCIQIIIGMNTNS